MQQRADNRTNRALAMLVATVVISGVFGTIAHAAQPIPEEPVTVEPVTTEPVVAVGLPAIPPPTIVVAVGLPPIPPIAQPALIVVAVGEPPIPPDTFDQAVAEAAVPQTIIELPETGASLITATAATVLTTVGAALAAISRRSL
jgi:hypothetical protein